jgi:putative oxidoreductase
MNKSSHSLLSYADAPAAALADPLLLVGRLLLGLLFLMTVWYGNPTSNYLASINYIAPDFWSVLARVAEWLIVISLIPGIATRYGALLGFLFVLIANITAHRWWGYPEAAQGLQYAFFSKDLAITGGFLVLFVTGGGRFSVDEMLRR